MYINNIVIISVDSIRRETNKGMQTRLVRIVCAFLAGLLGHLDHANLLGVGHVLVVMTTGLSPRDISSVH